MEIYASLIVTACLWIGCVLAAVVGVADWVDANTPYAEGERRGRRLQQAQNLRSIPLLAGLAALIALGAKDLALTSVLTISVVVSASLSLWFIAMSEFNLKRFFLHTVSAILLSALAATWAQNGGASGYLLLGGVALLGLWSSSKNMPGKVSFA